MVGMLAIVGVMVGMYCIARLGEMASSDSAGQVLTVFAWVAILIQVVGMFLLIDSASTISTSLSSSLR